MNKMIDTLKGHYVVCGYSDTGRYAVEELKKTGRQFVVIERDPAKTAELERDQLLFLEGDATADAVLRNAGITRAAGLISTLHSDADNLLVVLTARELNSGLRIVSKAGHEETEHKLRKVGADGVVMPSFIGGLRIASELVRPSVVTLLDTMLRGTDLVIRIEEIPIRSGSAATGRTLQEAGILDTDGVSVLALARGGEAYRFNPGRGLRLEAGDNLIVMGVAQLIGELRDRLKPVAEND